MTTDFFKPKYFSKIIAKIFLELITFPKNNIFLIPFIPSIPVNLFSLLSL